MFSMARLDTVKNLTGLVSWFANNKRLQKLVNMVIVGGIVDPSQSNDREEKQQCEEVRTFLASLPTPSTTSKAADMYVCILSLTSPGG